MEKNMNCEPALFHFLEVRCFLLKFEMGRSPDIETISQKSVEFSKNFKRGQSPDIETIS
jgi:hypothetical protein